MRTGVAGSKYKEIIMNAKQLRELVIRPVLKSLNTWSPAAEDLLLGTACQESHCGEYIRQVGCSGNVGAFGIWQMELATARDIYDNFLKYQFVLKNIVEGLRGESQTIQEALTMNAGYACAMARIHYMRQPGNIPADVAGQASYWKKYYNTPKGKGTAAEYIKNWQKYAK